MTDDYPQQAPEPNAEQLAKLGIFPPVEKRYDKEQKPYWVVPNQKILIADPAVFAKVLQEAEDQDNPQIRQAPHEQRAEAPEAERKNKKNSPSTIVTEFLRSLLLLLKAWLIWLFWRSQKDGSDRKPVPGRIFIDRDNRFTWTFEGNPKNRVKFRILRVNECPNDDSEYEGRPSVSVLVEWENKFRHDPGKISSFEGLYEQADNQFFINPELSSKPGHPPQAVGTVTEVYDSDFKRFTFNDIETGYVNSDSKYYTNIANQNEGLPIVAVMDTGLLYKWTHLSTGDKGREYTIKEPVKEEKSFLIAKAQSDQCFAGRDFGYCAVSEYLRRPIRSPRLLALNGLTPAEIQASPYDDNLVKEEVYIKGQKVINDRAGRHGTIITAILNNPVLNKKGCQVLPVKVFDCAGMGTLYDVLSGCNYILSRSRAGVPIRFVNASFTGALDDQGRELLYRKMKAMTEKHDIWIIAAAGNQHFSLDKKPLYPACFGLPPTEGGLEKVITVTSAYSLGGVVGNFGDAVSIVARSAFPDGFLSVLPIEDEGHLQGTSFAAPYAAAVLATAPVLTTRAEALTYLRNHQLPGVVSFENP